MTAMTSTIRFPGYFYNDLSSIIASVAPIQNCHYVIAGYTPFSADVVDNVHPPLTWALLYILTQVIGKTD